MTDQLLHALAFDDQVRVLACTTSQTVAEATRLLDPSPLGAAVLGRLLTGAALLAATHKQLQRLTLQLQGRGPAGLVLARAAPDGSVYGTLGQPRLDLPLDARGRLDVAAAVGREGLLQVVRDHGRGEPWVGVVEITSGEIGEDLAWYLLRSEQIHSAVGLGVSLNRDGIVGAGGFLVQILGGVSEDVLDELAMAIHETQRMSAEIGAGATARDLLEHICPGARVLEERPLRYHCPHDRHYYQQRLVSLGEATLQDLFREQPSIEVRCEFTGHTYLFQREDMGLVPPHERN
jgi:molecular chaperone Hsp33